MASSFIVPPVFVPVCRCFVCTVNNNDNIIIIIIISLLKQLTNRSHKTQYNEIRKKYTKEKQNVKLWCTRVNHGLNSQSGFMS